MKKTDKVNKDPVPTCFVHFIVIDINNGLKSHNLIHIENLCLISIYDKARYL